MANSTGSAGYYASGARFQTVQATTYLRNPSRYAPDMCGVGGSVALWASDGSVLQLGISDTTGSSGCAESSVYNAGVAPFDTHHVQITTGIHSYWCPAGGTCAAEPVSGGFPIGDRVTLHLRYDPNTGLAYMYETDAAGNLFHAWFRPGTGKTYVAATVTSDFGWTPWDQKGYLVYPNAVGGSLQHWYGVSLVLANGSHHTLKGWFAHGKVRMVANNSGGAVAAYPGNLNRPGSAFTTYLTKSS